MLFLASALPPPSQHETVWPGGRGSSCWFRPWVFVAACLSRPWFRSSLRLGSLKVVPRFVARFVGGAVLVHKLNPLKMFSGNYVNDKYGWMVWAGGGLTDATNISILIPRVSAALAPTTQAARLRRWPRLGTFSGHPPLATRVLGLGNGGTRPNPNRVPSLPSPRRRHALW